MKNSGQPESCSQIEQTLQECEVCLVSYCLLEELMLQLLFVSVRVSQRNAFKKATRNIY